MESSRVANPRWGYCKKMKAVVFESLFCTDQLTSGHRPSVCGSNQLQIVSLFIYLWGVMCDL